MSISIQSYKLCREEGRVSLFMQSVKLEKGSKPALSSFSQRSWGGAACSFFSQLENVGKEIEERVVCLLCVYSVRESKKDLMMELQGGSNWC